MGESEQGNFWDRIGVYVLIAGLFAGGAVICVLLTQQILSGNPQGMMLQAAAEKGDANSQFALGKAYQDGTLGLKKDDAEGLKWIKRAADSGTKGSAGAKGYLCYMYQFGYHAARDLKQAAVTCKAGAEAGDAQGEELWGYMLVQGNGVTRDYDQSFAWFSKAAAQGNSVSQRMLAYQYYAGLGVQQDYSAAADWYQKAASSGDAFSDYMLGTIYYGGLGRPKDLALAVQHTQRAAERGIPEAQMRMAWVYGHGEGVAKDEAQQRGWLQKAAGQGSVPAQCALAMLHFDQGDSFIDDQQATRWLQGGGQQDAISCMNDEAWNLATVSGATAGDLIKAETWATKALALMPDRPQIMDTLAAVYAAQGRFDEAVAEQEKAISGLSAGETAELQGMNQRLELYREHKPYVRGDQ